jgi:hypothetical protein
MGESKRLRHAVGSTLIVGFLGMPLASHADFGRIVKIGGDRQIGIAPLPRTG